VGGYGGYGSRGVYVLYRTCLSAAALFFWSEYWRQAVLGRGPLCLGDVYAASALQALSALPDRSAAVRFPSD
jgi:hypothetical protein